MRGVVSCNLNVELDTPICHRIGKIERRMDIQQRRGSRFWRYSPIIGWMILIFIASTNTLAAGNTSLLIRPLLLWLFPDISEEKLGIAHFIVRKSAHFIEYAVLGYLAARAFSTSSSETLRRRYFPFALLLVAIYSLTDEFHQSFVPSRTGSIYDSLIDTAGGLTVLIVYAWRRRK